MIYEVDMDEWILFSERPNSKNYVSDDGRFMLKVSQGDSAPTYNELLREKRITDTLLAADIPTPAIKLIVQTEEGLYGTIFEYIKDKVSIARAIANNNDTIDENMKIFADIAKKLHSTDCATSDFEDTDRYVQKFIELDNSFNKEQKEKLLKVIEKYPKKHTCLLGDFHTGNVIIANEKPYFIDLGSFGYGHPNYDLGVFYFITHYMQPQFVLNIIRVEKSIALKCWDAFAKYYFGADTSEKLEEVNKEIAPWAFIGLSRIAENVNAEHYFIDVIDQYFDEAFKYVD